MDTASVLTYLNAEWSEVIAEAVIDAPYIASQVMTHYADNADLEARWMRPLADYYLLRRALRAFAVDFDVTIDGNSYRLSQRKQLSALYADAFALVSWLVDDEYETFGQIVTVTANPYVSADGDAW
jgi:hypothetical protein